MKNRTILITALAALILAVSFSAWFFWLRPAAGFDRDVACKWDPAQVKIEDDTCDKQCALVPYRGGTTNQLVIKKKLWHLCCAKGYTPVAIDDPITHETADVFCRKD